MNLLGIFKKKQPSAATAPSGQQKGAETAEAQVGAGQAVADNDGLPSVNQRGNGRLGRRLGGIAIAIAGAWLLYAVNKSPSQPAQPKSSEKESAASSVMPPLSPPPPAPSRPPQRPPLNPPSSPDKAAVGVPVQQQTGKGKQPLEWYERKRAGKGGINGGGGGSSSPPNSGDGSAPARTSPTETGAAQGSGIAAKLAITPITGVSATILPNRNFLITRGNGIECTLETALDSTQAGMSTCVGATDVFSSNGLVKLLPKGTRYTGEYQAGIRLGQSRMFMVWTRAETPEGVAINLNSPGTDGLGRSGAEGWVDNHFAERFGAAFLSTLLTSSLDYAIAGQQKGTSTVIGDSAQSGSRVVEKILDSTINIPPTLHKNQGDEIRIMVARDLDFSSVYSLKVR